MNYTIKYSSLFRKSFKRCIKRGMDINSFHTVVNLLISNGTLPAQYHSHKLTGKYKCLWECHIKPDWLLIWEQDNEKLNLILIDTGSHSDLFK